MIRPGDQNRSFASVRRHHGLGEGGVQRTLDPKHRFQGGGGQKIAMPLLDLTDFSLGNFRLQRLSKVKVLDGLVV